MNAILLGTGEAFDEELPNSSVLVMSDQATILIDCGFTVPGQFWKLRLGPDEPAALYLTHMHGDHCFGLPALLLRLHEEGRRRPLAIIGPGGRREEVAGLLERAYPGWPDRLSFPLLPTLVEPGLKVSFEGLKLECAATRHGVPNRALRIEDAEGVSMMVSGDGEITPESVALMEGCSLVVHEAFTVDGAVPGHSSVLEVLSAVRSLSSPPRVVALTHTCRSERPRLSRLAGPFVVPRPGTMVAL